MPKKLHKSHISYIFFKYPHYLVILLIVLISFGILSISLFQTKFKQKVNRLPAKAESVENTDSENDSDNYIPKDLSENESDYYLPENLPDNSISQNIKVIFGLSQQVVNRHCPQNEIRDSLGLCDKVKKLALRDMNNVIKNFEGTGKTFSPITFDSTWDQTKEQNSPGQTDNCGQGIQGQRGLRTQNPSNTQPRYLPYLSCHHPQDTIYIVYLQYDKAWGSDGEAIPHQRYLAVIPPDKTPDGIDNWEIYEKSLEYVLTHEVQHLFGTIHIASITPENNLILENFQYPLFYDMNYFADKKDDPRSKWVFEILKNSKIPSGHSYTPLPLIAIPDIISFPNLQNNHGKIIEKGNYRIYCASGFNGYDLNHDMKIKPDSCGGNYDQEMSFENYKIVFAGKELLQKYPILFFEITDQDNEKYYTFLSLMEANLAYWKLGSRPAAEIPRKLYQPQKENITVDIASDLPTSVLPEGKIEIVLTLEGNVNGKLYEVAWSDIHKNLNLTPGTSKTIQFTNLYAGRIYRITPFVFTTSAGYIFPDIKCPLGNNYYEADSQMYFCRLQSPGRAKVNYPYTIGQDLKKIPSPTSGIMHNIPSQGSIMGYTRIDYTDESLFDQIKVFINNKGEEKSFVIDKKDILSKSRPIQGGINSSILPYYFTGLDRDSNYIIFAEPIKNGEIIWPSSTSKVNCAGKLWDYGTQSLCEVFPPAKVDFQIMINQNP